MLAHLLVVHGGLIVSCLCRSAHKPDSNDKYLARCFLAPIHIYEDDWGDKVLSHELFGRNSSHGNFLPARLW